MNFIKKMFKPVDMTEGKPWSEIAMFAMPMLIGNFAQQLYSTVDSVVVGKYVGDNALTAVGCALPIYNLLFVLFVGISMGVGIIVSQYFGAKNREELSKAIGNCVIVTGIATAVIMILAVIVTDPLLEVLDTPEDIFDWSKSYLLILLVGSVGTAYYNILSGVLRGLGDSVSALVYLLVCCGLNIILDIWFVAGFGLGVAGVAYATVISQVVSAALCLWRLTQLKEYFDFKKNYIRYDKKQTNDIIRLGLPSGITQAIFSLAMVIVQSLTNSFGNAFIAANVIVMRVDGFAMLPNFTFGGAMTTFAGQNVGAGRLDRVRKGAKQGTLMAVMTSAVLTGLILIFGKYLMAIFTDTEDLVIYSIKLMGILAVGYVAMGVTQSLSGVMRGAGDTMTPMWISLITTVIVRVPLAYGIAYFTRSAENPNGIPECIVISLLGAWLMGALVTAIAYRIGRWKKRLPKMKQQTAE